MTDQRDTPDTRTPSAEGCGHGLPWQGSPGGGVHLVPYTGEPRWGLGPRWHRCDQPPEPAPLGDAKGLGSDPTPVGSPDAPDSLTTGAEPTEDVAALVKRLRAAPLVNGGTLHAEAAAALEDLTRENERLREQVLDERAAGPQVVHDLLRAEAERDKAREQRDVAEGRVQGLLNEIMDLRARLDRVVRMAVADEDDGWAREDALLTERDAARAERDAIGARALNTLIEGGRCARRALRAEAQVEELNERNSSDLRRLDALVAQVAAVRALCDLVGEGESPSVYAYVDAVLDALDSAGRTEGDQP